MRTSSAPVNAVAVCPEGNELRAEESGRFSRTVYLTELTIAVMTRYEVAAAAIRSPKECFAFTPQFT